MTNANYPDSPSDPPSKSARKRLFAQLQAWGEYLAKHQQWQGLDLPPELSQALADFSRVKGNEGKRRQSQYIGKLMRSLDQEALTRMEKHFAALPQKRGQGAVAKPLPKLAEAD